MNVAQKRKRKLNYLKKNGLVKGNFAFIYNRFLFDKS